MDASMDYCKNNKPKLYELAEEGDLRHMPGVDENYEEPENAVLTLSPEQDGENTEKIIEYLAENNVFPIH